MASTASQPRVVTEPEREAQTRFARLLSSIHRLAYAALDLRVVRDEARERLAMLNRVHQEFWMANARLVVTWWTYLAGLLGVWFVDVCLSAPSSTFYATKYVHAGPRGVLIICVLVPTSVFLLELMIAGQRLAIRERAIESLGPAFYGWTAVGLLLVIVVPSLIASTQLAIASVSRTGLTGVSNWLRVSGITALSVVLHGIVIFSGKPIQDAKGYAFYRLKATGLSRKASRADNESRRAERRAVGLFTTYRREVEEFNPAHPEARLQEGPLQKAVVDLINEYAGATAGAPSSAEDPGSHPSGPAAPAAPPVPNRPVESAAPASERQTRADAPGREDRPPITSSEAGTNQTGGDVSDARAREADAEVVA